jgi:ribosomal-protein-alanine N-acetyltransferase
VSSPWLIREAASEHSDALVDIEKTAFGAASWGAASVRESIGAPYVTTLLIFAEGDAPPIGFAMWRRLGEEGEILSLGVLPSRQREGAADALLARVIADAERIGVAALFLEVDAGNAAARALYEKHGFARVGERRGYYRNGADALVLRRAL